MENFTNYLFITRYFCKLKGNKTPFIQKRESPKATPSLSGSTMESLLFMEIHCSTERGQLSHKDNSVQLQNQAVLGTTVQEELAADCFRRRRDSKDLQDSSCWPETRVKSIRKSMKHKYHTSSVHLLLSFNGRQQRKQHRWLHLWSHSVQT